MSQNLPPSSPVTRHVKRYWWMVIPLLLLTTALGARGLNVDSLWFDEYFSVYNAGGAHYGPLSLAGVWQRVGEDIFETPGHYLLLALWGGAVGWTEYAGRALSLLLGVLSVAWVYRLGRDIAGVQVGFSAALITATSGFYSYYLHEMRTYTLILLLSAICIWCYWRILNRQGSVLVRVGLVLSTAGLAYAHYMAVLTPLALASYHLLFVRKDRYWWQVPGLFLFGLILFLPWIGEVFDTIAYARTSETRQAIALGAPELVAQFMYMFSNASVALLALALLAALYCRGRAMGFAAWLAVVILALAVGIALVLPVLNHPRYFIALWLPLTLLVGLGVRQMTMPRLLPAAFLVIWLAAGVYASTNAEFNTRIRGGAFADLPWRSLAQTLGAHAQPEDAIAFHRPDDVWAISSVFNHYLHDLPGRYIIMETLPGLEDDDEFPRQVRNFISDADRTWLIVDQTRPPNFRLGAFRDTLAGEFTSCGLALDEPTLSLELFARIPAPDAVPTAVFEPGIRLYSLQPLTDDHLRLPLGWQVDADTPAHAYSVGLHLEDSAGQLVAQTDFGLPPSGFSCVWADVDTTGLAAGSYRLWVVVYAWESGERLLTGDVLTGMPADRLLLGEVTLVTER